MNMKRIISALLILYSLNTLAQPSSVSLVSDIWPPFTNKLAKRAVAFDIVNTALQNVYVSTNFEITDFQDVIQSIQDRKYDGSAALWKTPEREEFLLFSDAYLQNQLILVGKKGTDVSFTDLKDLTTASVGLVEGYAYGEEITNHNKVKWIYGINDEKNFEMLLDGELDYILVDALLIQYLLQNQEEEVKEYLAIGSTPLSIHTLHFAVHKELEGAEILINYFNREVQKMLQDGTYNKILHVDYIHVDVDGDGILELISPAETVGLTEPDFVYDVFYPTNGSPNAQEYYIIDGKRYENWKDIPDSYKIKTDEPDPVKYTIDF